ncbi:MAG: hypothetical protein ACI9Y1_003033 [Lentisphaeria bacterium]|jgi:hypothetical protein
MTADLVVWFEYSRICGEKDGIASDSARRLCALATLDGRVSGLLPRENLAWVGKLTLRTISRYTIVANSAVKSIPTRCIAANYPVNLLSNSQMAAVIRSSGKNLVILYNRVNLIEYANT